MALVTFVDDNPPYLNAQNLNNNFSMCYDTGTTIYSGDITTSGQYNFSSSASDYRYVIVELSGNTASQKALVLVPAIKIIGETSQYVMANLGNSIIYARITVMSTYLNVLEVGTTTGTSTPHIRSIKGIK